MEEIASIRKVIEEVRRLLICHLHVPGPKPSCRPVERRGECRGTSTNARLTLVLFPIPLLTHFIFSFLVRAPVQQQADGIYMAIVSRIVQRSHAYLQGARDGRGYRGEGSCQGDVEGDREEG